MIVSEDIRLSSMLNALTGVILPAVAGNGFAFEQAQLLAGHIHALRLQAAYADEYERLEHRYLRTLAADSVVGAHGGPRTLAGATRVRELLAHGVPAPIADVRAAHLTLAAALTEFIAAEGEDGSDESVAHSTRVVLLGERAQSLRDRTFFGSFGYEESMDDLPTLDQMMADFRAAFPDENGASV